MYGAVLCVFKERGKLAQLKCQLIAGVVHGYDYPWLYGVDYFQRLLIIHCVYAAYGYEQYVYMAHGFKGSFVRQVAYVAHMGKAQTIHLEYEYNIAAPLCALHFVMPAGYARYLYVPYGILAGG